MLQTTTNINIDFYDKKHILINAKQLDKKSRFLYVTCYNHGEPFSLNSGEHSAYIRYKKPDNNSVFNSCDITIKGQIKIELTEQMLAVDGICVADLVIVNGGKAKLDPNTGEITNIENPSILSSMLLHIDVTGTAVANSDIESSYEFDGLNKLLEDATAEYEEVILAAKSWAEKSSGFADDSSESAKASKISADNSEKSAKMAQSYVSGNTGVRANENVDNANYYYGKIKDIIIGLETGFIPMGTVSFSELASVEKVTGYVYNIRDDFVTDSSFAEGEGKSYTAGTNVYVRSDGKIDCFGGAASPTATVNEVKDYLGI